MATIGNPNQNECSGLFKNAPQQPLGIFVPYVANNINPIMTTGYIQNTPSHYNNNAFNQQAICVEKKDHLTRNILIGGGVLFVSFALVLAMK